MDRLRACSARRLPQSGATNSTDAGPRRQGRGTGQEVGRGSRAAQTCGSAGPPRRRPPDDDPRAGTGVPLRPPSGTGRPPSGGGSAQERPDQHEEHRQEAHGQHEAMPPRAHRAAVAGDDPERRPPAHLHPTPALHAIRPSQSSSRDRSRLCRRSPSPLVAGLIDEPVRRARPLLPGIATAASRQAGSCVRCPACRRRHKPPMR